MRMMPKNIVFVDFMKIRSPCSEWLLSPEEKAKERIALLLNTSAQGIKETVTQKEQAVYEKVRDT